MINSHFKDWIKLTTIITNNNTKRHEIECPNCQKRGIDYQYVGDMKSRVGFLDIWCDVCLHGIHLSRTKAPEHVCMIPFDAAKEYKERVPRFTHIEPS